MCVFLDREAFEETMAVHKTRFHNWNTCDKLSWILGIFVLQGALIVAMYGLAAYILVTEAMLNIAWEEDRMKGEWVAQREAGTGNLHCHLAILDTEPFSSFSRTK